MYHNADPNTGTHSHEVRPNTTNKQIALEQEKRRRTVGRSAVSPAFRVELALKRDTNTLLPSLAEALARQHEE